MPRWVPAQDVQVPVIDQSSVIAAGHDFDAARSAVTTGSRVCGRRHGEQGKQGNHESLHCFCPIVAWFIQSSSEPRRAEAVPAGEPCETAAGHGSGPIRAPFALRAAFRQQH